VFARGRVGGEVKAPERAPHLRNGRFWAEVPKGANQGELLKADPTFGYQGGQITQADSLPDRPAPPAWGLALMLGVPALVAVLLGWTLGAWPGWFPVLRRPRRG
jgi:hypothetical protein